MAQRVRATQQRKWTQAGGVIFDVPEAEDGAGNTIEGELVGDGVQGVLFLRILQANTGALLDEIEIVPDNPDGDMMKADSAHVWMREVQGRPCVRVRFGNHMAGAQVPEVLSKDRYDWFSPHLVAIPTGAPKMGRDGAAPIEGEPGGEPVDYQRIADMIKAGIDDLDRRLGGEGVREDIEGKVKDGVVEITDPARYDTDPKARAYQDATDSHFKNRGYYLISKHITGENPQIPVENQGFINLMEDIINRVLDERGV